MNKITPNIKLAKALPNYKLMLEFEDGVTGEIDLSKLRGNGIFKFWDDISNFLKVYISQHGSLAWNDDIEIDVLNCYLKITNQTFEEDAHN